MNVEWASHLAPEDIPPVDQRPVICLVDSGVDVTPDLPASRPEGPVVERNVVDALRLGGDNEDGQGGRSYAAQHGTRMASYAAAVAGNDWGTVGLVPWVRILSIRAMAKDDTVFPANGYQDGIRLCQRAKEARWPQLTVVALSLGCGCPIGDEASGDLAEAVRRAQTVGLSVVAAAGNDGGSQLATPAHVPGVIPVSAGDTLGGACSYATTHANALSAPGCGVDSQDWLGNPATVQSGGSSAAAIHAAAVIAVLRSLAPSASREVVEEVIRRTATDQTLNTLSAATELGLGSVARAGKQSPAGEPAPTAVPPQDNPSSSPTAGDVGPPAPPRRDAAAAPYRRPVLRFVGGHRLLRVRNRPRGADLEVRVAGRIFIRRTSSLRLSVRRWTTLKARFISDTNASPFATLARGRRR